MLPEPPVCVTLQVLDLSCYLHNLIFTYIFIMFIYTLFACHYKRSKRKYEQVKAESSHYTQFPLRHYSSYKGKKYCCRSYPLPIIFRQLI